ncbi:hypothetical protein MycrhN_5984 [Mycolicibacterium rhodesiae NBB3]|uniref:Uncharacterized protein n=1 Tax=Mycolicibacterium rhodesiae (strain NBB3) TaxID=710685 RepID=G8RRE3_MYCRN|nr:hypothetical protein [Mycolicibacterium rhodesiae]AEV76446.1 hypothetical protein MycrhN_5984 [Mycolicibacterium rhodesiae NBB3]
MVTERRRCSWHDIELNAAGMCDECSQVMPVAQPSTVVVFKDGNDQGYREWVRLHKGGYVLNIERTLNANNVILHQASCPSINGEPARGDVFVGDSYIKVCASRKPELEQWADENAVGTDIKWCQLTSCFGF